MSSKILLRRGTAAEWSSANPILGNGELGIETDTLKIKIGNGSNTWSQLSSYANVTPAQLTSQINSLISAAPSTLDTLNELAAAINNDASFSTTVNNLLTGKVSKSGGDTITSSTASTVGLIVKGASSQTGDLQQWQNSAGEVQVSIKPTSSLTNVLKFTEQYSFAINWGDQAILSTSSGELVVSPYGPERAALVVKGKASQTDNLQEWQNSAGTILAKVFATGYIYSSGFQVPVNGTSLFDSSNLSGTISLNSGGIAIEPRLTTNVALIVKGVSSQTANLQEWQNSSGTVLARVDQYGSLLGYGNGYFAGLFAVGSSSGVTSTIQSLIASTSSTRIGQVIKGASSQTANLQEWQNSAGTVIDAIGPYGNLIINTGPTGSNTGASSVIGGGSPVGGSTLTVAIGYSTSTGLIIKGAASQTADLQQWQNSASTVLAKVDANGSAQFLGLNVQGTGSGIVNIGTAAAGYIGLIIKGVASQTANLQEWQDSTNNILSKIDYRGILSSKVAFGDFWGPVWETVTAGSNDQNWKKLIVISLPDNFYTGIQFKIDINNAVTNYGSSSYPEKSTYTVSATRAGATLNDTISMVLTGPEGDKYIRGMKLSNGTYEIQFRQPADWADVVVRVQPISAQPFLRGLSDLYTFYPMGAGGTAASTGGTVYTPVIGGTDRFSFLSAQSFVKIGGTSSQFLKADGSIDSSTYMTTAMPYVAGHHAEGRYLASAALMNDLGNARLRGSTFTFTNISPTNSQIDTMFDGTAGVVVWTTSTITFPVVIEFTLPRTLQYGATVGVGFGNATWRANSVKIEAFSNGAWVTCIDTTTNTSEDVLANIPGSNATPGTTKLRYTFANPNSTQFRICHLWGFNYNSDMWTQLQMPRAGGTMYGSLAVQGYTQTLGTTNVVQNVVRGVSGQTSNLAEWQNSAGSVVASIAPDGTSTLGSMYITAGTHKAYGPFEILNNPGGNSAFSVIGFGGNANASLTIGIKNTDNANNRNWQLLVGGGGFAGQSGNYIGEGGLVFTENNPNDSSSADRAGFRRGGQFALGGLNTYSASLSVTPLSTSTIGQVIRANASQTANLQEWQQSDGSATYTIDANGHMYASASRGLFLNTGYISGTRFAVASVGASQIGMIIRGNTSQTGNLTEWRNVSDTVLASIDANGQGAFKSTTLTASSSGGSALTLVAASGQTSPLLTTAGGAQITAGGNYFKAPGIEATYVMSVTCGNAGVVPLTISAAASQTANLQEWKDSTGTALSYIKSDGSLHFTANSSAVLISGTSTSGLNRIISNGNDLFFSPYFDGLFAPANSAGRWRPANDATSDLGASGQRWKDLYATSGTLTNNSTSKVGLIVKAIASQTANLQEWQNSAGTVLTSISSTGKLTSAVDASINGVAFGLGNSGSASRNIAIGLLAGESFGNNDQNLAIGYSAGRYNYGANNVLIGVSAGIYNGGGGGSNNTYLGVQAGYSGVGSNNVMIGYLAGVNTAGDNKLVISNSSTATPLIGGDFSAKTLTIAGNASIISQATGTVSLIVKAIASQTNDLQQWQNSAGTVLAEVTASGGFELNGKDIELMNIMGAY